MIRWDRQLPFPCTAFALHGATRWRLHVHDCQYMYCMLQALIVAVVRYEHGVLQLMRLAVACRQVPCQA